MKDEKYTYIFGAGIIGTRAVNLFSDYGIEIQGILDNAKSLWGKDICGIRIQSPDILSKIDARDIQLLICCKNSDEVIQQVKEIGVSEDGIHLCNSSVLMMNYILSHIKNRKYTIFFDLSAGLTLGGVEAWSIQIAEQLGKYGYGYKFLVPGNAHNVIEYNPASVLEINPSKFGKARNDTMLKNMLDNLPCVLVSNFIGENFSTSCLAKHIYGSAVKHICIIHNDEENYYSNYVLMEQYIDYCLVISERICQKLLQRGFPKQKIKYLKWDIDSRESFAHEYSQNGGVLQLGYAGRVVRNQKRMDLMLKVVMQLVKRNVNFCLNIAGIGDYLSIFQKEVSDNSLEKYVNFCGLLSRENMPEFWKRQDIMLSCSEWEGHSITQCEAMAEGVVPILTDVSGVRDDVINGENGFVTKVGDIGEMVNYIFYCSEHREVLPIMGKRAYETIKKKYNRKNAMDVWSEIL